MPSIGDVCQSKELGRTGHNAYIWQSCEVCHVERWIDRGVWNIGGSRLCHPCYMKTQHNLWLGNLQKGSGNPRWKGGRKQHKDGYIGIKVLESDPHYDILNPMAKYGGYVLEHRMVIARNLNRTLMSNEIVHHLNGIRTDNRLENLCLLDSRKEHSTFTFIHILQDRIKELERFVITPDEGKLQVMDS